MCTVLLPPSDNPIAVNKYIIIIIIIISPSSSSSLKVYRKAFSKDVECESVEWICLAQDQIILPTILTYLWIKYEYTVNISLLRPYLPSSELPF